MERWRFPLRLRFGKVGHQKAQEAQKPGPAFVYFVPFVAKLPKPGWPDAKEWPQKAQKHKTRRSAFAFL